MCSHFYAYGLHLRSDVPLSPAERERPDTGASVRIREGSVGFPAGGDREVTQRDGNVHLRVDGVGTFRIGSDVVVVDRADGTTDDTLAAAVLGRVLAILLYQRGHFVMHGGAAVVDGRGVALVGHKTSGKSSLTAGLYASGHRVVTDDIVVLDPEDGWTLVPAFPRVKLTGESLTAHGLADDVRRPERKRWYPVGDRFERESAPLETVYVLEADGGVDRPAVEPVDPPVAMERVLTHSASAELVEATGTQERHFRECAGVADAATVKRLSRPAGRSTFEALVRAVEDDVR